MAVQSSSSSMSGGSVVVSPKLIEYYAARNPLIARAWRLLEEDEEVQELLRMSNIMAVDRLLYNDHGPVHARIVAGAALHLFELLLEAGVEPSTIAYKSLETIDEARLVVLLAAYLHDIGNAVHRLNHEQIGALMAKDILDRLLPDLGFNGRRRYSIRQEVMHAIYATDYNVPCLTIECGCVRVADGLDMAEGRARIPYRKGKIDIHAVSALSIARVEVERRAKTIVVKVYMTDSAGVFQVEQVLMPKILKSKLENFIEVILNINNRVTTFYPR